MVCVYHYIMPREVLGLHGRDVQVLRMVAPAWRAHHRLDPLEHLQTRHVLHDRVRVPTCLKDSIACTAARHKFCTGECICSLVAGTGCCTGPCTHPCCGCLALCGCPCGNPVVWQSYHWIATHRYRTAAVANITAMQQQVLCLAAGAGGCCHALKAAVRY